MDTTPTNLHRRKSSKDNEDQNVIVMADNEHPPPPTILPPPSRSRHTHNSSITGFSSSPSTVPLRSAPNGRPVNGVNSHALLSPTNPTFGHSHSPFAPPQPSPLSFTFPSAHSDPSLTSPTINVVPPPLHIFPSKSLPSDVSSSSDDPPAPSPQQSRRHTRIHSRNLSIFFPRPGSLPTSVIAEDDDTQELELKDDIEAPVSTIPNARSSVQFPRSQSLTSEQAPPTPLGVGFTFGGRPLVASTPTLPTPTGHHTAPPPFLTKSRRGHHHKHSMSHSFFSFLEPGANGVSPSTPSFSQSTDDLLTQQTQTPISPWSIPPLTATPTTSTTPNTPSSHVHVVDEFTDGIPTGPALIGLVQFLIGSWMWVCGQRIGSLSCAGIGYWVVFDAFGVGVGKVLPGWLGSKRNGLDNPREIEREALKRPYGNKRVLTVFMFAQAVYLMFSSVYICKETIEHVLLTAGDGHHHHPGEDDDWIGIEFPPLMTIVTFFSTVATALLYNNHAKLINVTGNRIPSLGVFLRSLIESSRIRHGYNTPPPNARLAILLSNPYTACPLFSCIAMFIIAVFLPPAQHRPADLVLAAIMAVLTFKVSYQACFVLGTVLLQTAPRRGLSSGKMESFLRVMREVERHPNVLHLPAPHFWQLTPANVTTTTSTLQQNQNHQQQQRKTNDEDGDTLIVTLKVHVREDLSDDEVIVLTKWTWMRCMRALGASEKGANGSVEVTVGIVRG